MMLFMFLLLPIMLVYSVTVKDFLPTVKQRYAPALIGFLVAALYSFIELFFFSAYYLAPYDFFSNYAYFFTFEVLIPCLLCFSLLFFCIKKQKNRFMVLYFILLGFYTVYFPSRLINRNSTFDWYLVLAKPILYASMLYSIKNLIAYAYQCVNKPTIDENKKNTANSVNILKFSLVFIACLAIPPAIDVMHLLVLPMWSIILTTVLYSIAAICGTALVDKDRYMEAFSKLKEILKQKNRVEQKED